MKKLLLIISLLVSRDCFCQTLSGAVYSTNFPAFTITMVSNNVAQLNSVGTPTVTLSVGDVIVSGYPILDLIYASSQYVLSTNAASQASISNAINSIYSQFGMMATNASTATNWVGAASGDATNQVNLIAQGILNTNQTFVLKANSTNYLNITNAGSSDANGTYLYSTAGSGFYTNANAMRTFITNVAGTKFIMDSNGVSLYSSTDFISSNWSVISGSSPAPTSMIGARVELNGLSLLGWLHSTNLSTRLADLISNYNRTNTVAPFTAAISNSLSLFLTNSMNAYATNIAQNIASTNTAGLFRCTLFVETNGNNATAVPNDPRYPYADPFTAAIASQFLARGGTNGLIRLGAGRFDCTTNNLASVTITNGWAMRGISRNVTELYATNLSVGSVMVRILSGGYVSDVTVTHDPLADSSLLYTDYLSTNQVFPVTLQGTNATLEDFYIYGASDGIQSGQQKSGQFPSCYVNRGRIESYWDAVFHIISSGISGTNRLRCTLTLNDVDLVVVRTNLSTPSGACGIKLGDGTVTMNGGSITVRSNANFNTCVWNSVLTGDNGRILLNGTRLEYQGNQGMVWTNSNTAATSQSIQLNGCYSQTAITFGGVGFAQFDTQSTNSPASNSVYMSDGLFTRWESNPVIRSLTTYAPSSIPTNNAATFRTNNPFAPTTSGSSFSQQLTNTWGGRFDWSGRVQTTDAAGSGSAFVVSNVTSGDMGAWRYVDPDTGSDYAEQMIYLHNINPNDVFQYWALPSSGSTMSLSNNFGKVK